MTEIKKIVLCVRRSRNYFHRHSPCFDYTMCGNKTKFTSMIYGWNMFFKLNYLDFRKKMSDISYLTYLPNNFDIIFFWEDDSEIEKLEKDTWIVPIDEDDWISPYLTQTLQNQLDDNFTAIKWNVANVDMYGKSGIENRRLYRSCSYALKLPCDKKYIKTNVTMSRRTHEQRYKIDDILAAKIDNVASITYFNDNNINSIITITKQRYLIEKTDLLKDYFCIIDKYNELLSELYDSCKV